MTFAGGRDILHFEVMKMERMLQRLERKFGRYAIHDLMKYLCIGMLGVFILDYLPMLKSASALLMFNRTLIMRGQVWRLITFIFLPPTGSLLFILLNLYFDYFLGTSLENHWGSARFNLYYLIGILGNIAAGFITGVATNYYLNLSLLLSFAVLYPEMEFMLFFVLPVKAKWLGLADAVLLIYEFIRSGWPGRIALLLSLLPFFLFFGKSAWLQVRMDYRKIRRYFAMRK